MQELPEQILVAAGNGDMDAFRQIYDQYAKFVYNVALRMVRHPEDAQEIAQDVFLLVHRKLKDFRFESSFKTWLYRITVNTTMNAIKRRKKFKTNEVPFDSELERPSTMSDHVQDLMDKEYFGTVTNVLLEQLNPDQRMCVVLRNMHGLSYEEIAETLDININTVRSRLKRAREKLLSLKDEVMQNEM